MRVQRRAALEWLCLSGRDEWDSDVYIMTVAGTLSTPLCFFDIHTNYYGAFQQTELSCTVHSCLKPAVTNIAQASGFISEMYIR